MEDTYQKKKRRDLDLYESEYVNFRHIYTNLTNDY